MPGVVGLVTKKPAEQAMRELQAMIGVLRHEAFYECGTWSDERLGIYIGWTARKNAFDAGMPLWNETRDRMLVFSGEEYPEPGAADRMAQKGHTVATSPASYLIHLAEDDEAFPEGLNGRFHGVLVDLGRSRATLFNDRFGLHRLYIHESADTSYFAAEAKAILEVRPETRAIDPRGMGELVSCGCVLENRTIFKGVQVMPAASAWTLSNGVVVRRELYFAPSQWEQQPARNPEEYFQELRRVFVSNLPRYFQGAERIGMSLTGGLDTRMIMAWHKCQPGSMPCYSFGGMFHECRDVRVARNIAQSRGQSHCVIPVADTFLSQFGRYAERTVYLTDGCVDVSHSPDLYANEQARAIAPVRMTGNYGGEVLRQVRAFKPVAPAPGLFDSEVLKHVAMARQTYASLVGGHPLSFAAFHQTPWHHYGLLALEQTQLTLRSPYLDNDFVRTVFQAPRSVRSNNDVCLRLIEQGDQALSRIPTDRGLGGNRPAALAAVERRYLDFTFKAEYAYDYGMPQWVAKIDRVLRPLRIERLFLGRHKFKHFRIWYREALSRYVGEMLLDPRTLSRPYLERRTVERMVSNHMRGTGNFTSEIHKTLTLELIHRLFVDRN